MPATGVLLVLSVGSSASAPMEAAMPLRSGVQCGLGGLAVLASVVFQMPPLTVPIHIVFGALDRVTIAETAPATGDDCACMPATCPFWIGAGPWATKLGAPKGTTFAVTVAPLAIRSVTWKAGTPGWWLKPGVIPAATAALSTATCTSFARAANGFAAVALPALAATRTSVSDAKALVLVSLPASPTRESTCFPRSAPRNSTV